MILSEHYTKVIRDNNINPVGNPTFDNLNKDSQYPGVFNKDNSYAVDILVDVLPKLDVVGYDGLVLEKPTFDEQAEYETKLMAQREQFAERVQITDRGAQLGDALVIDFKGMLDGMPFNGGSAEGYALNKLGQSNFIPGFEEQIVGMKAEETKTIKVKFPDDYKAKHLAGKDADFEIKVHSIIESKLANVDNDLALMVGHQTVEEMEAKLRDDVKQEVESRFRAQIEKQIIDKLKDLNKVEVPDSMIRVEQSKILQNAGVKPEQVSDSLLKSIEGLARYNSERSILIDAVYDKEPSMEINPDELDKLLEEFATKYQKTKDEFVSMLYNTKQMDSFVHVLRAKKVIDFIIERSKGAEEVSK
jgi:trigger factor